MENLKSQYLYFEVLETNIDLLKEEIHYFYPQLKLSFSQKTFLTYKSDRSLAISDLEHFQFVFALQFGLTFNQVNLTEDQIISFGEHYTTKQIGPKLWPLYAKYPYKYFDLEKNLNPSAPSRAYLKIKEAVESLQIPILKGENILELGSAPGGATYYLTEKGFRVFALDPAEMDPIFKSYRPDQYIHLHMPAQKFNAQFVEKNFRSQISWIVSDMNLSPFESIEETVRIAEFIKPKGFILTLKIPTTELVGKIEKIISPILKISRGKNIIMRQLHGHKREFLLAIF